MTDDEARWIARAGEGDAVAFRRLVEAHSGALYRVCARITGDRAIAEDAVQEAFFNAYRHLRDFDGRAAFSTWLHRIGVNAALEQMRRRGRGEVTLPEGDDDGDPIAAVVETAAGPERHARSAEIRRDVESELARMRLQPRRTPAAARCTSSAPPRLRPFARNSSATVAPTVAHCIRSAPSG